MRRRHPLLIALAVLLVVAVAAAAWLARPVVVPAVVVKAQPLVRTLQFSARAATTSRVEVGPTITGRVAQVDVREGAEVRAGQVLVRLEHEELAAALAQAQAAERQAQARLAGLRSSGRSGARAGLAQAEASLVAAVAESRRVQDLVARGFVSEARLDETQRAVAVAQAQRDAAQAQIAANADAGTDVAQADAAWALARAAREAAAARLAQALIRAPADARVLERRVEPGQIVQPGRALLALALAGPLQLVAQVDERYLQQLQVGQAAAVLADAFADRRFQARIASISPLVDAQRGAVEVKLAVAEPPPFLREDMTLSVEVETARRDAAIALPQAALRGAPADATGRRTVWLEIDGRVQARAVRTGLVTVAAVEILEGLAEGDRVLLGAAPAPGSRVRADPTKAPPPGAAGGTDVGSALSNAMGR